MSKKLYSLIKSLSPNEKGYFKKFASIHSSEAQNTYLHLFEIIDENKEYASLKLPKIIKKNNVKNQIHAYTSYLYSNILDALKNYHSRKTIESEIKHLLNDVELLYAKDLFAEAKLKLPKARELAYKHECWLIILDIIAWELKIEFALNDPQDFEKAVNRSWIDRIEITNRLTTSFQYEWLYGRLISILRQFGQHVKDAKELHKLEEIMKDPLMISEEKAVSLSDKNTFYLIHSLYNYIKLKQNLNKSIDFTLKRKQLMEDNIEWASKNMDAYLGVYNNLILMYMETSEIDKYDDIIEGLKKMPEQIPHKISIKYENLRLSYINTYSIARCFLTAEFETGLELIKGKEVELENIYAKVGHWHVLAFYDNIRSLYFAVQNYKKALFWNNKILNYPEPVPDIYSNALVWNIIIHSDLGNLTLVESLIKSAIRMQEGGYKFYKFGKILISSMTEIVKSTYENNVANKNIFRLLKRELISIRKNTAEIKKLDYLSYLAWINAHIEEKKYVTTYRKLIKDKV